MYGLFVIWQDGDGHAHYHFLTIASSVDSARKLAVEHAATHDLVVAYASSSSFLDPAKFYVGLREDGWRKNDHFVCEPLLIDRLGDKRDGG